MNKALTITNQQANLKSRGVVNKPCTQARLSSIQLASLSAESGGYHKLEINYFGQNLLLVLLKHWKQTTTGSWEQKNVAAT